MPRGPARIEQLFDRTWRPGHPLRRRLSPLRRWGMFGIFLVLIAIITTYWRLTDSGRVREMAESYLSQLLGGRVTVQQATLSIFEGLRLDGVHVYVGNATDAPDAEVFSAATFIIKYDPESILRGKLEATQIVAREPHVKLCENLDTGQWNMSRLSRRSAPANLSKTPVLPEILLRDAQYDYAQIIDGKYEPVGTMAIEGKLVPRDEANKYDLDMRSRGESEGLGPQLSGTLAMNTGEITAELRNFQFGQDIKALLPALVRKFFDAHDLSGGLDVPVMHLRPVKDGTPEFYVETDLKNVTLSVRPEEWMSQREKTNLVNARTLCRLMDTFGCIDREAAKSWRAGVTPVPIRFDKVDGRFIFTQDGIKVPATPGVSGWVENNPFTFSGYIHGYKGDGGVEVTLTGDSIYIPHAPRYAAAMPRDIRELFAHLRPEGVCSLNVTLTRPANGRASVRGNIHLIDGNVCFDQFPYPLRKVTGDIAISPDPQTGESRCDIRNIVGLGVPDGANRDNHISVNGFVNPLVGAAEVVIVVKGTDIRSEPALKAAMPHDTQRALEIFDPAGKGEYPTFRGNFECDVHRPPGPDSKWITTIDLDLAEARGAFVPFPYPMDHVSGKIHIDEGYLDLIGIKMDHGDTKLNLAGRVRWGHNRPITEQLTLDGHNLKIDQDLLGALPANQREWLVKLGLGGTLDLTGKIGDWSVPDGEVPPGKRTEDVDYDLQLTMRDGTIYPVNGQPALTQLAGQMHLSPTRLSLWQMTGKRGDADVTADGTISWPAGQPRVLLNLTAKNLAMDNSLYAMLPPAAQTGWDSVQPVGTVDAEMSFAGGSAPSTDPATNPGIMPAATQPAPGFDLLIHPRKFSITAKAVPYRLDDVKGTISIRPDAVKLTDLKAHHGLVDITVAGSGTLGDRPHWDLTLTGANIPTDEDFKKALPPALRSIIESINLQGVIGLNFSKLEYRGGVVADGKPADPDIDVACKINIAKGTIDAGVPLREIEGTLDLTGNARAGKLNEVKATIDAPTLTVADRATKNFRGELYKPAGHDMMQVGKMQANLAGGEVAGEIDVAFPDKGPAIFALSFALHNADVKELAPGDADIQGQVNASLALEGNVDDPHSRRGRGDVVVAGRNMYHIPLMLGLSQVTNLALPISSPFNEGTARYSVEGSKVTFEQIELRASNMLMQGTGSLDFDSRKVKMTFVTDNPNWPKVPFVSDLFSGASKELLQIHVSGTVQEPKVSAASMNTFFTTIDQVTRGNESAQPTSTAPKK